MPFQGPYNVDFVYSTASSAHVVNHRDWFLTYTDFPSRTQSYIGSGLEVLGVGDVHLEVNALTPGEYRTLVLRDVLYIPNATTNLVAAQHVENYTVCSFGEGGSMTNPKTGETILLDCPKLYKLWLVGQSKGQTSLDREAEYMINVGWPRAERQRWEEYKRKVDASAVGSLSNENKITQDASEETVTGAAQREQPAQGSAGPKSKNKKSKKKSEGRGQAKSQEPDVNGVQELHLADPETPAQPHPEQNGTESPAPEAAGTPNGKPARYSEAEKAWLKQHYGNEFKMLKQHGLKIFREEDRQEGERIVRSMMQSSPSPEDSAPAPPANEPSTKAQSTKAQPTNGHATSDSHADSKPYNKTERKWLQNGFSGEGGFLKRYGLSFASEKDRAEGRWRARRMMEEDGTADMPELADMDRQSRDAVADAIMYVTRPY